MNENILIAYYSRSANTRIIAKLIYDEVGGTIFEIQPEKPYPMDYNMAVDQARKEIQRGYRPTLKSKSTKSKHMVHYLSAHLTGGAQ